MTEWLENIAANLLRVERDVRTTLRAMSRGERPTRQSGHDAINLNTYEARVLLHGAMPAPIVVTRLREPHARLVAALSVFHAHLIRLNDPFVVTHQPDIVLTAAVTLIGELRAWHRVVQWRAACRRAKVKFPLPPRIPKDPGTVAISSVMRLDGEQTAPTAAPTPKRPQTAHALSAHQAELDFGPPRATAEIIDIRQMHMQLFKTEENAHASAA